MCKYCDKHLFFDNEEYHADSGYGDNDYTTMERYEVLSFVCPVCGKLKVSCIEKFGSMEKALVYLMVQNLKDEMVDKKEIVRHFSDMLNQVSSDRFVKILEQNGLVFENNTIRHNCGHVLLSNYSNANVFDLVEKVEAILTNKNINFCPRCGKKILPFNKELDLEIAENCSFHLKQVFD